MIAKRWFENRVSSAMVTDDPEKRQHELDRMTARTIAIQTMFCPCCGRCSDMRRMIWTENDTTGMIIPHTVFCGLCERSSASEGARAIAARVRLHEGRVISFHCPNKIIAKRLNKALEAGNAVEPIVEIELVNQSPRKVVFRFRGKESIGLECLKHAQRANPDAVLVTRRI